MQKKYFIYYLFIIFFLSSFSIKSQSRWYEKDSKYFKIVYRAPEAYLVPHIEIAAEKALHSLMKIFNYTPSEKIVISLYDASDYGFASTTSVPENFIRLEVEPFEYAYENIPFNERFQWVLSHELVHVVVGDKASNIEGSLRSIFSKVEPEKGEPMTIFYSLLTNYSRYTPRWHQEGIAVFFETWLSGGYGRVLGNFDEMYFRSMVADSIKFPSYNKLDAKTSLTNFLLGTLYYLYGERFCTYLAINYGTKKLIDWYEEEPGDFYEGFKNKFEKIYGITLDKAWNNFAAYEKAFQLRNIKRLKASALTPIRRLSSRPIGWATRPHFDKSDSTIIFGYDGPDHLAGISQLKISNSSFEKLGTLPTPSLIRVASTALDTKLGLFFYTTKNNELYRDIRVMDIASHRNKMLFENCRTGDLTVSNVTHDLWGVMHSNAEVSLVVSPYPYHNLFPLIKFNVGDQIFDLSISPDGKMIAAALHRSSGQQSIILVNADSLKKGRAFKFQTITDKGSPENPSWSPDGKYLYWDAYVNGVANIYRENLNTKNNEPMSNTLSGLFMPLYVNKDSLFAFEFTPKGFLPVLIPNKPVSFLPAIKYLGEKVVEKDPQVTKLALSPSTDPISDKIKIKNKPYNSISNLKVLSFIPVITGFQNQKVIGLYTHISDPLIVNDLTLEIGISPSRSDNKMPRYHLKAKYLYKQRLTLAANYNAPDFYDLFNQRKRGMIGTKLTLGYTNYWLYDNPLKIKQTASLDYYTGVEYINDNLVHINIPDFSVLQSTFNVQNVRRSIGSIDNEEGNSFNATAMAFGAETPKWDVAGQIFGEWDHYLTWLFPHNIFHLKLASGYSVRTNILNQAKFYFGGFGNRRIEDADVNQYRNVFRFPGISIYSLSAESFGKFMVENVLPPLRFGNAVIGQHYLSHISLSFYSEGLLLQSSQQKEWVDIGSQINFVFRHWYNLESTFSAGIAKAWYKGGSSWQWFLSYKLLK